MSEPRLRAPKEHGAILAVPPVDEVGSILARSPVDPSSTFLDRSLADLRVRARQEVLAHSTQYHHEANETISDATNPRWLVAGHQPELFHPGVWYKNFVLHALAKQHHATSLNLIIDTDAAKPAILHVPAGDHMARMPYDRSTSETPYEERMVEEESTFASLPDRVASVAAHWGFEPMLASFWREAKGTPLLGERFARARRAIERRWGMAQREVPMSRVCQTEAFATFACAIVHQLPRFHAIYNEVVREYRHTRGIKSRSHPVPDLAAAGDWLETPFWAWRRGEARRRRLFVRVRNAAWDLRIGNDAVTTVTPRSVESWQSLEAQGFKVRSRALTTTMFARLFLADMFVHGIGGGIYDALTDRIIERAFGIAPPPFLIVSATLLLPLPRFPESVERKRRLLRLWRDLVYKPDRFVERDVETESLIQAKQEGIARIGGNHRERVERFERIREINARLFERLQLRADELERELDACEAQIKQERVASRRDYAFCLYPESMLRSFFAAVGG